MLSRVPLTPEGITAAEATTAIDALIDEGVRVLNFSFHSPTLEPGHTPYVRDESDRTAFYGWWDRVLSHLARRGVAANGFEGCTFDRRAWGLPSEERFALVVGSDLIYDPGVVAPLVATAAASLAPGGRFVLAQSFALGDASSTALADACAERKLALEVVESAGEARVWEMVPT